MNVLVYSGPEALPTSLKNTLSTFRRLLRNTYTIQSVSTQVLKSQPWSTSCALFVFPECKNVSSAPQWISSLDRYVENGGSVICLSSGVLAKPPSSEGLQFKIGRSSLYPTYADTSDQPKSVNLQISGEVIRGMFQTGMREFVGVKPQEDSRVLATYHENEGIAALECKSGKGKVMFWAPSLEYPITEEPARSLSSDLSPQELEATELRRLRLLQLTLTALGTQASFVESTPRPLPQFLVSQPTIQSAVSAVLKALETSVGSVIEDANDNFHFHTLAEAELVLQRARQEDVSEDPATWQPKRIIVCPNGKLPESTVTPIFDVSLFFRALTEARSCMGHKSTGKPWGFGDVLLYGEAVTSTQTMLDKNPHFLSKLPVPFLSIGSHQVAGRGRGSNSWISPAGCLQFSLLLRLPLSSFPASKLVFVQYLIALAMVEACRDDTVLGPEQGDTVRIKWPNDLYAVTGEGEGQKKKIGGILVSTSFSDGQIDIVIGCGLNVLNPPPILSLSQLQREGIDMPLSMEKTAAAIMAKFENMWPVFVASKGDFTPFMDLYLERWLHSDQLVQITTTSPPTHVRICGITFDHGLLRTLPERRGWDRGDEGFIDLQPDGNSFDLMSGLIKSKS
ncbi:biotin apo-protein [Moniliophthora roreri]|uniref:BPL/LPL catalytic domain-containing protein n=1 Tax=Moniliophthora roreri TaxID=221103 RepID=A0A0W0FH11_MONRR|nr:biotin apo-protein [Moniliophthora roreri]